MRESEHVRPLLSSLAPPFVSDVTTTRLILRRGGPAALGRRRNGLARLLPRFLLSLNHTSRIPRRNRSTNWDRLLRGEPSCLVFRSRYLGQLRGDVRTGAPLITDNVVSHSGPSLRLGERRMFQSTLFGGRGGVHHCARFCTDCSP